MATSLCTPATSPHEALVLFINTALSSYYLLIAFVREKLVPSETEVFWPLSMNNSFLSATTYQPLINVLIK